MIYTGNDLELAVNQRVWTNRWNGPEEIIYLGYDMHFGFRFKTLPDEGEDSLVRAKPGNLAFVCADTREELLSYAIQWEKDAIAKHEAEISCLEALMESSE